MTELSTTEPTAEKPKKILRLGRGYGIDPSLAIFLQRGDIADQLRYEKRFIATFEEHGYVVERGGTFDLASPLEIGINMGLVNSASSEHARNKEIAAAVGAIMPEEFTTPESIINSEGPIIAKRDGAQQGYDKYYLDTLDKKARFLTWALLGMEVARIGRRSDAHQIVERLIHEVKHGNFSDPLLRGREGMFGTYIFQKFMDTPGEFHSSFRIVSDAFGKTHYGLVLRSPEKKGVKKKRPLFRRREDILRNLGVGMSITTLLTHPDSPFYIDSPSVVSNYSQGGKAIVLNGQPVSNEDDKRLLRLLEIDPDNPRIPEALSSMSGEIGTFTRADYPYCGNDFVPILVDNHVEYPFLESNTSPGIDPEDLDLPPDTSKEDCQIEMLRRVLA